jgi:hypothetical protein
MRKKPSQGIHAVALATLIVLGCDKPEPLTAEKATEILGDLSSRREPVYAEVPQRVWWNPKAPKDDYDEKAVRTLRNLERAGLVTVKETLGPDSAEYVAKVTQKGFPILGTAPSHRGPVYRATICWKRYDGVRGFMRHPSEPTVGHAEIVWHYDEPTWLYPLFETKINKPLKSQFTSQVSFWYEKHAWHYSVVVPKTRA